MRASSRSGLEASLDSFERLAARRKDSIDAVGMALFAMVDALDFDGALRRTLTNPNIEAQTRREVVGQLMGSMDPDAVALVEQLVSARWSGEGDLADAVEQVAFAAMLASAQADGDLESVEDELYRLDRLLVGNRRLRVTLSDRDYDPARRVELARDLLQGKVCRQTMELVERIVSRLRSRTVPRSLGLLIDAAAARRKRLIAEVTAGSELSAEQERRLGDALAAHYGRDLQLNISVDRTVLGGMRIQVGTDLIDATMLARLQAAGREMATHA